MYPWKMHTSQRYLPAVCFSLLLLHSPVKAWGPDGHAAVGILAVSAIDSTARTQLKAILGNTTHERIGELCNWPDNLKSDHSWDWAYSQHYVNLPRYAAVYDQQRDCPEGLCVTEAIKKYAAELANQEFNTERREQAFAWLCHLVGDLHQPLHSGFADDRGGNTVDVEYQQQTIRLHQFWDSELILDRAPSRENLVLLMSSNFEPEQHSKWNLSEVNSWTDESHALAASKSYPQGTVIEHDFEERSWLLIEQQIPLAASRLARILDATLGEGELEISQP